MSFDIFVVPSWVTNFLPKLVDIIFHKKNWISIFPLFLGIALAFFPVSNSWKKMWLSSWLGFRLWLKISSHGKKVRVLSRMTDSVLCSKLFNAFWHLSRESAWNGFWFRHSRHPQSLVQENVTCLVFGWKRFLKFLCIDLVTSVRFCVTIFKNMMSWPTKQLKKFIGGTMAMENPRFRCFGCMSADTT